MESDSHKNLFISLLLFVLTINVNAQFDHDYIGRDEFSILKSGSNLKSASITKASKIKSKKIAEQQFGTNYRDKRQFAETKNAYFNHLEYDDGLELSLPEDQRLSMGFHIKSDQYILSLANGQTIKVGMKADELKAIFPKSYSKRTTIENIIRQVGKVGIVVYFSSILDGHLQIWDSRIIFILNKENGKIEEFYSYEPS